MQFGIYNGMAVNEAIGAKIQGYRLKYLKDKSIKYEIFYRHSQSGTN